MKYEGLFTLNPIETVIKINKADERTEAQRLISSFVVTPSLAKTFDDIVLPQLSLLLDIEGKGIFIVGNYGTGKSHVMIFISVFAEDSSYLDKVMDPEIRGKFSAIAGKYVVRRTEIVSQMSVYGIITTELSKLGKACGFEFSWKPMTEVVNNKNEFKRFMEAFEAVQPEKGVLLVVDELLHYLQGRNDHDLENDLAVLRAVGEFCDGSRFAFMAGLQQSLFNNPRFNHMAQSVNRVKQRFHDVVINDRNVFELVEQYLFHKDGKQRDDIRQILQKQFPLYEKVAPDIERFIAAFPAHPNFIDEFQRVYVIERRETLTVLTKEVWKLMTKDVDENHLDLITADKYWQHVEQDQFGHAWMRWHRRCSSLISKTSIRIIRCLVTVYMNKLVCNPRRQRLKLSVELVPRPIWGVPYCVGLGCMKMIRFSAEKSPWLKLILERLQSLGEGQVLNQSDLFEKREERSWMKGAAIEAEWVHVLIAAGVEAGLLVVTGPGNQKIDAANLSALYQQVKKWEDIVRVARPADVPIQAWRTRLNYWAAIPGCWPIRRRMWKQSTNFRRSWPNWSARC